MEMRSRGQGILHRIFGRSNRDSERSSPNRESLAELSARQSMEESRLRFQEIYREAQRARDLQHEEQIRRQEAEQMAWSQMQNQFNPYAPNNPFWNSNTLPSPDDVPTETSTTSSTMKSPSEHRQAFWEKFCANFQEWACSNLLHQNKDEVKKKLLDPWKEGFAAGLRAGRALIGWRHEYERGRESMRKELRQTLLDILAENGIAVEKLPISLQAPEFGNVPPPEPVLPRATEGLFAQTEARPQFRRYTTTATVPPPSIPLVPNPDYGMRYTSMDAVYFGVPGQIVYYGDQV